MVWKILVIDDDEDDFIITRDMLKEAKGRKYDVRWASTFEAGREALLSDHFNAVLVDYDLGLHTGIQLIREANSRGYAAPLILFTGRGSYDVDVEAMEAGATLYLTKGEVNSLLLERGIRYAIEIKHKEQSLRESEAALQMSEERFYRAFNANPVPQVISRLEDGFIEDVNNSFLLLYGYERLELIGKTSLDLNMYANPADRIELVRLIQEGRDVRDFELDIRRKSGEIRQASLSAEIITINQKPLLLTVVQDITERKRWEASLRESEARLRALVSASAQVLYRMSPDWSEMHQLQGGNFLADTEKPNSNWMAEYIHPDDRAWVGAVIENAVRTGSVFELEHQVLRADGTIGWTASRAVPVRNVEGEIIEWFGAASDITERKRTEQALQENEALLDAFFANSPGILNIVDTEFRYIKTDPITPTYFGLDRQSIVGKSLGALAPEFLENFGAMMRQVIETGQTEQKLQVQSPVSGRSDAMTYWLASYFQVPLPGGNKGLGVMGVDISEQKKAELALKEIEQRYSALFNAKTNAIAHCRVILDAQGRPVDYEYLQVNEAYEAFIGMKPSEIVGRRAREVFPGIEHSVNDYIGRYGQIALQGGELNFETIGEAIGKWLSIYVYSPRPGEFTVIFSDISQRKQAEAEKQEQAIQIEVQRRLMNQREQDRISMAQDLHDGPIQTLSSTMFHLQMIMDVFTDPMLQTQLLQLGMDIKSTIRELRDVLNDLRPPALIAFGFSKVLQQYIEDLRPRVPELEIALDAAEADQILSAQAHLTLFRIFQAGINNIIRHSNASKLWVVYKIEPDSFSLELRDNGAGFDMNKDFYHLTREGHFGLVGMRERAEAIGAEFSVSSEPGKGTTIVVKGPYTVKNLK